MRWSQNHRALVAAALRSWSGHPVEMRLHLDDAAANAPQPGSGGGKIMRAQAEALAREIQHSVTRSKGTPGLRRLDYASTACDGEAEWLVLLPGERGERF